MYRVILCGSETPSPLQLLPVTSIEKLTERTGLGYEEVLTNRLFYLVFLFFPTDTICQYNLYRYYVVYVILSLLLLSFIHCTHKFLGTFCTLAM